MHVCVCVCRHTHTYVCGYVCVDIYMCMYIYGGRIIDIDMDTDIDTDIKPFLLGTLSGRCHLDARRH